MFLFPGQYYFDLLLSTTDEDIIRFNDTMGLHKCSYEPDLKLYRKYHNNLIQPLSVFLEEQKLNGFVFITSCTSIEKLTIPKYKPVFLANDDNFTQAIYKYEHLIKILNIKEYF